MSNIKVQFKKLTVKSIYFWVVVTWLSYAALTLFNPHKGSAKYNLTASQTNLLQLTIVVPILAIWLVAAYGVTRFRRYAQMIKDSPDGAAASTISSGLVLLIVYLLFSTLISSLAPYAAGTSWANFAVILKNQLPILIALSAFSLTYWGSYKLVSLGGEPSWSKMRIILFLIPYCVFAVLFTWVFYLNPDLHGIAPNGLPAFVLDSQALLFTYVIPYLIIWFLGCLTALNIRRYSLNVKGTIYRSAFFNLVIGIISVVLFTIMLQLFSAASATLNNLNLASILLLVYIIIILDAVGYAFIALGAKKLSQIEEAK